MIRYFSISFLAGFLGFITPELFSQNILPFGDITLEELSNKQYKPDPGADAIILSDVGIAKLEYDNEFYIELERDVRIRVVNSNGFNYANIEIPYQVDDRLINYRASTFNTKNGEKTETRIPKKSFIIENTNNSFKTLKFNFPDVHEGSVIEYSYILKLKNSSIFVFVPWAFQSDIPVINSSITMIYPDAFTYKNIISGSAKDINTTTSTSNSVFFGKSVTTLISTWSAQNVPAFRDEPYILSKKEHLTRITFELASVDFPNISFAEISPTYKTLTEKLLDRDDFGTPLKANLKTLAEKITKNQNDELSKLKKIHEYISSNILWNGVADFTTSSTLRNVMRKETGNSADINMILIAMLRSLGIKADPIILSTRSNGSLNQFSAMFQQFNYLVASVSVDRHNYIVDATDPLRPFNLLPFDCLNGVGRLISEIESKFVDLKNNERFFNSYNSDLILDTIGNIAGNLEYIFSDYSAYDIRKLVKLESEEGYLDIMKSLTPNAQISDFKIKNSEDRNSDLAMTCNFVINNGAEVAGDELLLNLYFSHTGPKNIFFSPERKFPIDFGCPVVEMNSIRLRIPEGYSVIDKPSDVSFSIGKEDGKFEFNCQQKGNILEIKSEMNIYKTVFQPSEYAIIQQFYSKIQQKQTEFIVLKKNTETK